MTIKISKVDNKIIVSDGEHTYSRPASSPTVNQFGYEMDFTIRRAFDAGTLYIFDADEMEGDAYNHGTLYADSL